MSSIEAKNVNHPEHRESLKSEKYHLIREAILVIVPEHDSGESVGFDELEKKVAAFLAERDTPAELFPKPGSVRWYTKAVQLDLEARDIIERLPNQSPIRFRKKPAQELSPGGCKTDSWNEGGSCC